LILIWDQQVAEGVAGNDFGNPVPPADVDGYWVLRADTLAELTGLIAKRLTELKLPADHDTLAADFTENVRQSVARYNELAESGLDTDFHRGETPVELALAAIFGPGEGTNPTMSPLAPAGPYYATILGPGTLDTKGGPRVDTDGRVLRPDSEPIDGLYGAGNCVASPSGEGYWAGGGTIGPILCYAYLAGKHVAARQPAPAS
jgi:3-oxosteroid 1-dehydrogenase